MILGKVLPKPGVKELSVIFGSNFKEKNCACWWKTTTPNVK